MTDTTTSSRSPPAVTNHDDPALTNHDDPALNSDSIVIRQPAGGESPTSPLRTFSASVKAGTRSPEEAEMKTEAKLKIEREDSRAVTWILRRLSLTKAVRRAAVAARMAAAALCLVSFSVMSADKNRGWAVDSFYRYKEYRYCLSVNVIGFFYAGFQSFAEVRHIISKKNIIRRPLGNLFDFTMDQVLAYLLISASSSAMTCTNYWVTNWGTDRFPNMISGSVAVSFLAFLAFTLSSLISAYNLFNRTI